MAKLSSSNGLEKRPKLRFPGFDEPYKQCRIGDIYAERSQRGASNMELLSVTMNGGVKPRSEIEGKDNSSEDKSNYKIVRKGDMVYNSMRMWQGANGISPCDGIVSPAYTVLMPKQEINNGYFAALFKSANLINEFRKNSQGMTSDTWNLKYPQIETIKIQIPSVSEQDKVSELFGVLDARIVAQAQLIEALKKYKRGSLSALFPKKGEITPQYRFAGFTKPWEQRKLGEVGSVSMCRRIFKEQTSESGDIPFYKIGTFGGEADAFISKELFEEYKAKYPYPKKGDILISASGSIGRTVEFTGGNEYFQDSNIVWLNHDEHLDNSFLKCFYSVVKWAGIEGSTIKRLYNNNILNTVITLPSVAEQQKIGQYFSTLDRLITLHQHKYDILLSLKNALLQQLFI